MTTTIYLNLQELEEGQNNVPTMNRNFAVIAAATPMWKVEDEVTAPPSHDEGKAWYIVATATGDFTGLEGNFAVSHGGGWVYVPAVEGDIRRVKDTNANEVFDGSSWAAI